MIQLVHFVLEQTITFDGSAPPLVRVRCVLTNNHMTIIRLLEGDCAPCALVHVNIRSSAVFIVRSIAWVTDYCMPLYGVIDYVLLIQI